MPKALLKGLFLCLLTRPRSNWEKLVKNALGIRLGIHLGIH